MNKLVKGAIAGAAGIALLLGGAGSLALWNSSATITSATINAGTLTVTASGGAWSTNPALWVPGDTFTYTATLTVTAKGTNLVDRLTVDSSSITGGVNLLAAIGTPTFTATLQAGVTLVSAGVYAIAPSATPYTIPVTVTVTFPSSITGTTAQGESVNLTGLAFKLAQQ